MTDPGAWEVAGPGSTGPQDSPAGGYEVAFYAAAPGGWRDYWNLLHPPYTAWHLAYVVIGACLAPVVSTSRLVATLLAFFAAVGLAAHALDELRGRPLRTRIPASVLIGLAAVGLAAALALGLAGLSRVGWSLIPFLVIGPVLVVSYNLELFGGVVHTDAGFAVAWGAFPVLTAYVAQTGRLAIAAVLGAVAAYFLSLAQRRLSKPARVLRRRVARVEGRLEMRNGDMLALDQQALLVPLDQALRALSWGIVLLAGGLAVARLS